ncbi:nitrous oxide reductase family maturation protein NosD [Thermoproteota archaeon]
MSKISAFILILLLSSVWITILNIGIVKAQGTIYIRADGSVEGTDTIQREGNVYTFTDNIYDSLVVERDDIVIDGVGYSLGSPNSGLTQSSEGIGILVDGRDKVTISNVAIQNFLNGIYINSSSNSLITKSNVTNNNKGIIIEHSSHTIIRESQMTNNLNVGIYVLESPHTDIQYSVVTDNANEGINVFLTMTNFDDHVHFDINFCEIRENKVGIRFVSSLNSSIKTYFYSNNITHNSVGIYLEVSSVNIQFNNLANNGIGIQSAGSDNHIDHNNFINNTKQVYDSAWDNPDMISSVNNWYVGDNGNYWSDYDGTGETPYVIDENNQDNFPTSKPLRFPNEPFPHWVEEDFTISNIVWSMIIIIAGLGVFLLFLFGMTKIIRKNKKKGLE